MAGGAVRRTLLVLALYALVAWLLVLPVGAWLRRVLALPILFRRLLQAGVVLGVPVAAVLAWYYPRLGQGTTGTASPEEPSA